MTPENGYNLNALKERVYVYTYTVNTARYALLIECIMLQGFIFYTYTEA